jgi:hypothetical protein
MRRIPRSLPLAACMVAVLLTSGCVTTGPLEYIRNGFKVGPNYGQPPAPVAEEWIDAKDPNVQSRHLQYADWWSVFKDPTLNSLIATAYEQNLNLRIAGTRVLQARAQQAIAVGNFFPQTQQATGGYSRIALSHTTFNNPFVETSLLSQNGISVPPNAPIGNFYSDWTAGFNLSWELDFWGRLRRAIESANANLDSSVENFDNALVTLLADVATNYVQYRVAQQRIKIARDNLRTQEKLVALLEQQYKVGTATSIDVDQLRTLLEQTRSTIPSLQITLGQASRRAIWNRNWARGQSWATNRCRIHRPGSPPEFQPTCCAAAPISAAPSARWRPRAPKSVLRKQTFTPRSSSTAPSVTKRKAFPSYSSRGAFLEPLRPTSGGTF